MSVAKTIEISTSSREGFQQAIEEGIRRAGTSVQNIKSAWVKDQQVTVEDGKITEYRINLKVTFLLN